jgi:hypothetical protein
MWQFYHSVSEYEFQALLYILQPYFIYECMEQLLEKSKGNKKLIWHKTLILFKLQRESRFLLYFEWSFDMLKHVGFCTLFKQ